MWLKDLRDCPGELGFIIANMRSWDRKEIFATRTDDDPTALAEAALACGPISWVAGRDALPIAAFGCAPMWNGVWSLWLFATDDFGRIGISVTRLVVKSIIPMMVQAGAHRLEARSMEGHTNAQAWLEMIGASREATLRGYGRDGQDFHVYTWPCA